MKTLTELDNIRRAAYAAAYAADYDVYAAACADAEAAYAAACADAEAAYAAARAAYAVEFTNTKENKK